MLATRLLRSLERRLWLFTLALSVGTAGCEGSSDDDHAEDDGSESADAPSSVTIVTSSPEGICNLGAGHFSANIDNPWFPLPAGQVAELRGEEAGGRRHDRRCDDVGSTDKVSLTGY